MRQDARKLSTALNIPLYDSMELQPHSSATSLVSQTNLSSSDSPATPPLPQTPVSSQMPSMSTPLSKINLDTSLIIDDNVITTRNKRRITILDGFLYFPFIQLCFFDHLALTILLLCRIPPGKSDFLYELIIRSGIIFLLGLAIHVIITFFKGIARFFAKPNKPIIFLSTKTFHPYNDTYKNTSIPLINLTHIELLPISNESIVTSKDGRFLKWNESKISFEINLVAKDGQRFPFLATGHDLYSFKNTTSFLQDATTMANLLNLPIFDGWQRLVPFLDNPKSRKAYTPANEHLAFSKSSITVSPIRRFSRYFEYIIYPFCIIALIIYLPNFFSTLMKGSSILTLFFLVGIVFSLLSLLSTRIHYVNDDRDFPFFDLSSQVFYPQGLNPENSLPFTRLHHLELNRQIFPRAYNNAKAQKVALEQSMPPFTEAFELNAIAQDNSRYNILYTKDFQSLSRDAKKLAEILNIPVLYYEGNPVIF